MIYAVIPLQGDAKLPDKVWKSAKAIFDTYAPAAWFVDFDGTGDELSDLIWPDGEESLSPISTGIILRVSAHCGYASNKLWEWLKVHSK